MPRATALEAGLRSPARAQAPKGARDIGRALGLTDSADILAETVVTDSAGGSYGTWAIEVAGVPARLDPLQGSGNPLIGDQASERARHILTVLNGTTLTTSHRVVIGGRTWLVASVTDRTDELVVRAEVIES